MPQTCQRLRDAFNDDVDAMAVLEDNGWTEHSPFVWHPPAGERSTLEWDALQYLVEEWDHGYAARLEQSV